MIKNNLKSLFIHIIISFTFIIIFLVFFLSGGKWASEEAAIRHHNRMMFMAITMIGIALILYYLSSRKFLINQGNLIKNLLSTILVAIIGSIIWVIAYKVDFDNIRVSYSLFNSELWQIYCAFNGYSMFFLNEYNSKNHLLFLLFSFMPTIAMSLGILRKDVPKQPST